ncbi:MAG: hypothetical protein IAE82_16330 [Opitutaceae bacterium]|nr:hypothetical protein [Opitutaceae bacterium]
MKTTTPIAVLLLTLAGATAAYAEHPWRSDHLGFSLHTGSFELDGPPGSEGPDGGEEDLDMFGLRAEGHVLLGDVWYARGVADLSRLDDDAGLMQASVSIGTIRALATWDTWNLDGYAQAGVEYVRSSDLDSIVTDPVFGGSGSDDEVGASVEVGLSLGFRPETRVDLFAKYLALGDGGVSFGLRLSHDLNETWTLIGGLDAVWVEDVTQIDLDSQRFSIGVLRKF